MMETVACVRMENGQMSIGTMLMDIYSNSLLGFGDGLSTGNKECN